jgi:two-component system NarL family sensor kinase
LKAARPPSAPTRPAPPSELVRLRARVAEADETLRAIHSGEVDTVVVAGKKGDQVFTLDGAEHAYRVLIESMNEGAVTLTADKTIVYANQCFARMVKCPLEQVTGNSMRRFLSTAGRAVLRPLLRQPAPAGSKIQLVLNAADGSQLPVQMSIQPVGRNAPDRATVAVVVTDMTEARRTEELLRALTNRVLQVQEAERGRVALELHDHITQLLCAILFRSQALVDELSTRDGPSLREAMKLREMLGTTAAEVERISRNLRPGVLDQLGLVAVLRATSTEFAARTKLPVELTCVQLTARLPADTELTLYRILQEALKNVEKHAHADHVSVSLARLGAFVQLTIKDDGVGFDASRQSSGEKRKAGLGLLSMRERAAYAGGVLEIKSVRGTGTEIMVRLPLLPKAPVKAVLN